MMVKFRFFKCNNSSLPGRQATENHTKNEETAMVLYFTGTGNSRYLARRIAERLEMPLYDLNACIKAGNTAPVQTGRDAGHAYLRMAYPPGGVGVAG